MRGIYFDACCLNRPFDDQSQPRIRLEAEAVLLILSQLTDEEYEWIGSEMLDFEVDHNPDPERRQRVRLVMTGIRRTVAMTPAVIERGEILEALGFKSYDALHIACAEEAAAEVLLTTDDRMLRLARRAPDALRVRVANPVEWIRESE